jgi:valyl-tRNA synthetase
VLWDEKSSDEQKNATRYTLLSILEQSLRMTHPLMPFITEEIWQKAAPLLGIQGESILLQRYPQETDASNDAAVEAEIAWLQGVILGLRNIRGELNISPARTITALFNKGKDSDRAYLETNRQTLFKLAKLDSVRWLEPGEDAPPAALQLCGELEILVPLAGLIDVGAEKARLSKEIDKLQAEITKVTGQLGNERFVANAPDAVVARERERLAAAQVSLAQLQEQFTKLGSL